MAKNRWYRIEDGFLIKYWEHDGAAYLRDQKVRREVLCPLSEAAARYPDKLREVPGYSGG